MALSNMLICLVVLSCFILAVKSHKLLEDTVELPHHAQASRALASSVQITSTTTSKFPSFPKDLFPTALSNHDTLDDRPDFAIFIIDGVTFWILSHRDNRLSMFLALFDSNGVLLQVIEKKGASYIFSIKQDSASGDIILTGQAREQVRLTCAEINKIEIDVAVAVPRTTVPQKPSGLKLSALKDPSRLDSAPLFPTLVLYSGGQKVRCWPFSFIDNRVSMSIVCFDNSGRIKRTTVAGGARYIFAIKKKLGTETYKFIGQANRSVTASQSELIGGH